MSKQLYYEVDNYYMYQIEFSVRKKEVLTTMCVFFLFDNANFTLRNHSETIT